MNTYMLSFNSLTGKVDRETIQKFFDTKPEILNWFGAMPKTLIIISDADVTHLTKLLTDRYGDDITFLITPINPHEINGYISRAAWDFINNPKSSGRWNNG